MKTINDHLPLVEKYSQQAFLEKFRYPFLVEMGTYTLDLLSEKSFQTTRINIEQLKGLLGDRRSSELSKARVFFLEPTADSKKRGNKLSVGRASDNDIILDFPLISKRHAFISYNEFQQETYIQDAGSTNKIYVDDREVLESEWEFLRDGGVINFSGKYFYILYKPESFYRLLLKAAESGQAG